MKAKKDLRILLLGLDNAGKTTIITALTGQDIKKINPTKGFGVKCLQKDSVKFTFWDLGGQKEIREAWKNYFDTNDALVIKS